MIYGSTIKADYLRLWSGIATANQARHDEAVAIVEQIYATANQTRYKTVATATRVPWQFIGCLHNMECGLNFNQHLHNGDDLRFKTHNDPKGRPLAPTWTWETSAVDALTQKDFQDFRGWAGVTGWLYAAESYNGWGYRMYHPETPSPYLWGGSNHERPGKYVSDGQWDSQATTDQVGVATLMHVINVTKKLFFPLK